MKQLIYQHIHPLLGCKPEACKEGCLVENNQMSKVSSDFLFDMITHIDLIIKILAKGNGLRAIYCITCENMHIAYV
jgi:hypothetical protein